MPGVDLNYFIRQANKLTEKIEKRKKELAEETVEGKAGDGRVTVVATGIQEIRASRSTRRRSTRRHRDAGGPDHRRGQRRPDAEPASTCSRSWRRSPAASRSPGIT